MLDMRPFPSHHLAYAGVLCRRGYVVGMERLSRALAQRTWSASQAKPGIYPAWDSINENHSATHSYTLATQRRTLHAAEQHYAPEIPSRRGCHGPGRAWRADHGR